MAKAVKAFEAQGTFDRRDHENGDRAIQRQSLGHSSEDSGECPLAETDIS
jgi:hypothetical protein